MKTDSQLFPFSSFFLFPLRTLLVLAGGQDTRVRNTGRYNGRSRFQRERASPTAAVRLRQRRSTQPVGQHAQQHDRAHTLILILWETNPQSENLCPQCHRSANILGTLVREGNRNLQIPRRMGLAALPPGRLRMGGNCLSLFPSPQLPFLGGLLGRLLNSQNWHQPLSTSVRAARPWYRRATELHLLCPSRRAW